MPATPATLILGAGRSGYGAAKLLHSRGEDCLVSDLKAPSPALARLFESLHIPIKLGPQGAELLAGIQRIIVSPGISPDITILQEARRRGLVVESEIDLALHQLDLPWIGITGTNGKSTCTTWLAQMLKAQGIKAAEVGNIGRSPSEVLAEKSQLDCLVVELSSYQISTSKTLKPKVSLFTSFAPDHLERHGSLENYFTAKWRLIEHTEPDGLVILSPAIWNQAMAFGLARPNCQVIWLDDGASDELPSDPLIERLVIKGGRVILEGQSFDLHSYGLKFSHEIRNAVMCILAAKELSQRPWLSLFESLTHLQRLPYRFQSVGFWDGQRVINDSKSTNVESTLTALTSLAEPCYLLLGGIAKEESFQPLLAHKGLIQHALIFGHSREHIAQDLAPLAPSLYPDLASAIKALTRLMKDKPRPVLFSPACASFDAFENFEARGLYLNDSLVRFLTSEDA